MRIFQSLTEALSVLLEGGVVVLPTDTVYGIVARAEDPKAVAKLYDAKHRHGKPGTVIAANVEQLADLGIDAKQLSQVAHLWPASVSVILQDHPELAYLDQGAHSLAVRIPQAPDVRTLLLKTGPLLTSSANMPGQPPATTVAEAQAYFADRVDAYVDGGLIQDAQPSTIVRIKPDGEIEIVRQGAVQLGS